MKKINETGYSQGGASYTNPGSSYSITKTTPAGLGDERQKHSTFPYSEEQSAEYVTFSSEKEKVRRKNRFKAKKKKRRARNKKLANKATTSLPVSNPIDVDRGRRNKLTPGYSSINAPGMQHPNALRSGYERIEKVIIENLFETGIAVSGISVQNAYGRGNNNVQNTGFGGIAPTVMKTRPGKKGGIGDYYGAIGKPRYGVEEQDPEEHFTLWDIISSKLD